MHRMRLDRLSRSALLGLLALLMVAQVGLVYLGVRATQRPAAPAIGEAESQSAEALPAPSGGPAGAPRDPAQPVAWAPPPAPAVAEGESAAAGDLEAIARLFDVEEAMAHVEALAAAEYGGRQPGTPGHAAAGEYIAERFREYGLLPAVDGAYYQAFAVSYARVTATPTLRITAPGGQVAGDLAFRQDFSYAWGGYAGGGRAEGPVYWLSDGLREDYAGMDVVGGIVLCRGRYYEEALRQAVEHGAGGLLLLAEHENQITMLRTYREAPYLPDGLPTLWVNEAAAEALLAGSGYRPADLTILYESIPLETEAAFEVQMEEPGEAPARNVLGLLPGADPEWASQVLVLGAHYDHLGTDGNGDIYYGANDDASGIAAILEIARSWQAAGYRPDTSVLFAAWDAEEQGLLGATHYVGAPPVPLSQTVGMIQLDMVGLATEGVLSIGGEDTDVGRQAAASAALWGLLTDGPGGVTTGGSDHLAFSRAGVPAVLLSWDGFDVPYYHTPHDTPETLQPERLREAGVVASHTALALSSAHGRVRAAVERQAEAIEAGNGDAYASTLDPADLGWQEAGREWLGGRAEATAHGYALTVESLVVHGDWATAEVTPRLTDAEGGTEALPAYPARLVRREGDWYGARPVGDLVETPLLAARFVSPWRPPIIVRDELAEGRPRPAPAGRSDAEWAAELDATYARVLGGLGHTPALSTSVTVYPTDGARDWLASGEGIEVSRTAPLTETAVALALTDLGLPAGAGGWLRAGLADWLGGRETLPEGPDALGLAVAGLPEGTDPAALLDVSAGALSGDSRAGARSLVAYLLAEHGTEGIATLCRAWGETGDLSGALAALGTTPEALSAAWHAGVGEPLGAARAGIAETLDRQAEALLAGDRAAYLATIDAADPLFLAEQGAWFDASAPHVTEFSQGAEVTELSGDEALASLTITARGAGSGGAQRQALPVRFRRQGDAWLLRGPALEQAPGAPLAVRHTGLDAEDAAVLSAAVERAYRQVTGDLGLPLPRPLDVRAYPSDTLFHYTLGIDAPDAGRDHYAPGEAVRLSAKGDPADYAPRLARLLARAALAEAGLADPWLAEGLALLAAARAAPDDAWRLEADYVPRVREAARLERLPDWAAAPPTIAEAPDAERILRIGQAWMLWDGVVREFGVDAVRAMVRRLAGGDPLPDAFAAATGRTLTVWEPAWREDLLAGGVPEEARAVAKGFDPERALAAAYELASPGYSGRQPGSAGAQAAAEWIAGEMATAGLQPAGADGGYLVGQPISYTALSEAPVLAFRHAEAGEALDLPYPEGFREALAGCAGGGEAHGGLVWIPEEFRTGFDLAGRVVMKPQVHSLAEEAARARQFGAGGLILVASRVDTRTGAAPIPGDAEDTLPVVLISEDTWRQVLALAGLTTRQALDAPPALLLPVEVDLQVPYTPVEERMAEHVVGVVPGVRPDALPLVVIAHYDGVGALPGGPHYPGANKNAAGVGVMLEAARRVAGYGRPERSIYFLALGAEEMDLAGTRHHLAEPLAGIDEALGYLVLDQVGSARSYYLTFDGDATRDGRLLHDLVLAGELTDRRVSPGNHPIANSHDLLQEAGQPAVLLFWPDPSHVHRLEDTPEELDPWKLATTGEVLTLALLMLAE